MENRVPPESEMQTTLGCRCVGWLAGWLGAHLRAYPARNQRLPARLGRPKDHYNAKPNEKHCVSALELSPKTTTPSRWRKILICKHLTKIDLNLKQQQQ